MPSYRLLAKIYRLVPLTPSTPMVVMRSPNRTVMKPLIQDLPAKPATVVRPKIPRAKYSGGPNFSASWASGMETRISATVLRIPA